MPFFVPLLNNSEHHFRKLPDSWCHRPVRRSSFLTDTSFSHQIENGVSKLKLCGVPSLAASTPLLNVLLALALVPVFFTLLGCLNRWYFTYPLPFLWAFLIGIVPSSSRLLEGELLIFYAQKPQFLKALKTISCPYRSFLPETCFDRSSTSVFEGSRPSGSPLAKC